MVGRYTKNGHFKDSRKNIRMETNGNRPLGRPRLRWLDDVCDDLNVLKDRNCKELGMDRKFWSDLKFRVFWDLSP
jgi:hypothetical protein